MKSYKVLSHLNHDNLPYKPGEEIGLDDRTAKPLLEGGVIEPMPEQETTVPGDQSPDDTGDQTGSDAGADSADMEQPAEQSGDTGKTGRKSAKAK